MYTFLYSILLVFTLQHSALSADETSKQINDQSWMTKELLKHSHLSSSVYANLALEGHLKKIGDPSEHLALVEKSLYKNPYRTSLYRLRSEILKKGSYSSFEIPMSTHLLTAFKPLFTFLIFIGFLLLGTKFTGRLYNHRLNFTKAEPNLGFYALSTSLLSILFFSLFLWHFNKVNQNWACVASKGTDVFSAPSAEATVVRSLPEGSCLPVKHRTEKWAGFSTFRVNGWVSIDKLEPVRGR